MIKVSWVLSLLTFIFLSLEFFETVEELPIKKQVKVSQHIVEPLVVINELLDVEKRWLELQKQADLDKANKLANTNKAPLNNGDKLFTVGDSSYRLLGIFVNQDKPFILVRKNDGSNTVMKIILGQELSTGIVLSELTSNTIKLQGNDEIFEIKLFERNTDEAK